MRHLLNTNGRPSSRLQQIYSNHGLDIIYDSHWQSWGVCSAGHNIEDGILYRTPQQLTSVSDVMNLWHKFFKLRLAIPTKFIKPPAWQVTPQEFWQEPVKYEINVSVPEIRQGMDDGTLHKKIIRQALQDKKKIPKKVMECYQ